MRMGKWVFGLWISILLGPLCGGAVWAKPADLPVPSQPECKDGKEDADKGGPSITVDLLTGRITVESNPTLEPAPAIDAVCPAFLSALVDQLVTQIGNALAQPRQAPTIEERIANQLYRDAEACARHGQLEKARMLLQQTHLLAPTSRAGQKAIERLQEIEERLRDSAEESTDPPSAAPDPEASYRDLRDRTVPLGLIVVSY